MPDPVTLGHVLMLVAALVALYGLVQLAAWLVNRSFGRGTPQYARARDGKRFAAWSFAVAALLLALACLTPIGEMALA